MTHTTKIIEARDRIHALAEKRYDAAKRLEQQGMPDEETEVTHEAIGLDLAVKVIEDILAK